MSLASCQPRDAFVQHALEERGERHHPQQLQAVRRRRHRRRNDVAGADAGRGDEQSRADQLATTLVWVLWCPAPESAASAPLIYAPMTSTAAATARILADAGIERVFGLPGGEVLVLIDELRRAGVDFVLMRHEANAGIAAAVYGKLRGQPGVVLTTLGPGAANLMLPLCSAYLDQEPLLAISAQIPDEFPGQPHAPAAAAARRPTGRWRGTSRRSPPQRASTWCRARWRRCMERPFGASYLTLSAREALKPAVSGAARRGRSRSRQPLERPGAARAGGERSRPRCGSAKRPLVVIGLSIDPANAARIRRWVTEWNLPVAVTPKVKGIVDETAANFVGVVGGMAADGVMCDAIAAADLVVGFGLDPVEIDKTWHAERPIHWVLESPNAGGIVPPGVALVRPRARSSTRSSTSGRRRRGRRRSRSFRTSGCGC